MKHPQEKKPVSYWIYIISALLCVIVLPVSWLMPFRAMPILDGTALENDLKNQVLEEARAGLFEMTYTDEQSVCLATLQFESDDVLTLAYGNLESDQGTFPFAVLLKKLPFLNWYLYDTRYCYNQFPVSLTDIKYVLMSYTATFDGAEFSVEGNIQEIRVILFMAFPVLWLNRFITRKLDPE